LKIRVEGGAPSRGNTKTLQTIESGRVVKRLAARVSQCSFWDFRDRELERQEILSFSILNREIVNQPGFSIIGIVMSHRSGDEAFQCFGISTTRGLKDQKQNEHQASSTFREPGFRKTEFKRENAHFTFPQIVKIQWHIIVGHHFVILGNSYSRGQESGA
jgi:hypothetical protein